jgi:hypothetical protein
MGSELKANLASYRLLYFQPDPEDGERIAVGILLYKDRKAEVLYDKKFPKLKCFVPYFDPATIAFYLETLQRRVSDVDVDLEVSLRRHAPQILASEERKVAWPLTEQTKLYLIERFLHHRGGPEGSSAAQSFAQEREEISKRRLTELVEQLKGSDFIEIHRDATPQWVLGRKIPQMRPVAIAIRKVNQIILVDGVDLNVLTPQRALSAVNKIVHTFWQYGRFRQETIDRTEIKRIGVVLNGVPNPGPAVTDAHDFALDQFKKESEATIDASSPFGRERLRDVLQRV